MHGGKLDAGRSWFGGLFLYASFWVGAVPDGGWFAYTPLTSEKLYSPGLNMDFWDIGLSVAEVAAMAAAAELIIAYYWLPKITGRLLNERLGRWNFWTMFIFFNVTFFPMHISGLLGMPRRVYTYPAGLGWEPWNLVSTVGAFGLAAGILLFVVNVLWSLWRGPAAGNDPWQADTLEWSEASPAPQAQFPIPPVVRSRHPLWEQTSLEPEEPALARLLSAMQHRPVTWRGALVVSVLDARPLALVHLPGPTPAPFVLAVGFVGLFAGVLIESLAVTGVGAVVSAAGTVAWFWPQASERRAIEEVGTAARDGELPLVVSGQLSNGWWGTLVLLLVLATALASLIASYWYLGAGAALAPGWSGRSHWPILATALIVAGCFATSHASRMEAPASARGRRLALLAGLVLLTASLGPTGYDLIQRELSPSSSAAASIVFGLLGFHWLVTLLALSMLGVGLLWAVRQPADPRGRAALLNASLVTWYVGVSWLVVGATVYLTPHLG